MASGRKYDHPPLLAPGAHYLSLPEIKALVVDRFDVAHQPYRLTLFQQLEQFVQLLLSNGIRGDLAVDGSFFTEKPNPSDVDVLFIYDYEVNESLTPQQYKLIYEMNSTDLFHNIDSFAIVRYPRDHELFGTTLDLASERNGYGIENGEQWTKGYVIMRLWETKIGCRIRN